MNDIKLFATNEKEMEALMQEWRIYNHNIETEFGMKKIDMLIMRSTKDWNYQSRKYQQCQRKGNLQLLVI